MSKIQEKEIRLRYSTVNLNGTSEALSAATIRSGLFDLRLSKFWKLLFAAVLRIQANCCFHGSSLLTAVTETQV